jgi:putative alpha-1,2-mannosidase
MTLRNRLNRIEKAALQIKAQRDNSELTRAGVWHYDRDGNIIEGSGVTCRVPSSAVGRYGILLTPAPVDAEQWCEDYQDMERWQREHEDTIFNDQSDGIGEDDRCLNK